MSKLYWIVCEDKDTTLFEGRYQGRTRGEALKFLKQTLGRKSLGGLVFTITEIPVPLIREMVMEILGTMSVVAPVTPVTSSDPEPEVTPVEAQPEECEPEVMPVKRPEAKVGNPGHGDELWDRVRAYWQACGNLREAARKFGLSPNSVKTRARREGWKA